MVPTGLRSISVVFTWAVPLISVTPVSVSNARVMVLTTMSMVNIWMDLLREAQTVLHLPSQEKILLWIQVS